MVEPMQALTILQPFCWAIFRSTKRCENRQWRPPPSLIGKRFAIHAGKSTTDLLNPEVRLFIEDVAERLWKPEEIVLGAVVGTAKLAGVVTKSRSAWFRGKYGWQLEEVFELPVPVACRGKQGLWRLPDDVLDAVRVQEIQHGQ